MTGTNEESSIVPAVNESFQEQHLDKLFNTFLYIDGYLQITHLLFPIIGIPLNLGVMALIVGLKRLHSQRTFTWLGVGLCNVLVLLAHLNEFLVVYWDSPVAKQIYVTLGGLPYAALLFSNFSSFLERNLCVKFSKWYKRHIKSCWVVLAGQIGFFLAVCIVIAAGRHLLVTFIMSQSHQQQMPNISDLKIYSSCVLTAFAVCVATQVSMTIISRYTRSTKRRDEGIKFRTIVPNLEVGVSMERKETICPFVQIGQERISQLDVEAARTVNIIGLVHLISYIPGFVTLAHVIECFQQNESSRCSRIIQMLYYMRELISIPCFSFSPIYFALKSRDIRKALWERVCRRTNGSTKIPSAIADSDGQKIGEISKVDRIAFMEQLKLFRLDSINNSTATIHGIESICSIEKEANVIDF